VQGVDIAPSQKSQYWKHGMFELFFAIMSVFVKLCNLYMLPDVGQIELYFVII